MPPSGPPSLDDAPCAPVSTGAVCAATGGVTSVALLLPTAIATTKTGVDSRVVMTLAVLLFISIILVHIVE